MNKVELDIETLFRMAMRRFPAAVTVVTTRWNDSDVGMTASAVTSLSMEPPSLLVCANRGTGFYTAMADSSHFCVNILREGQQDISTNFGGALPPDERFGVGQWERLDGIPYLVDAQASIFCTKTALFGGVYIGNEGFTKESAEAAIAAGEIDAVAFGKSFIANPDLPKRLSHGAALNAPKPESFYMPGPAGYIDYPMMEAAE